MGDRDAQSERISKPSDGGEREANYVHKIVSIPSLVPSGAIVVVVIAFVFRLLAIPLAVRRINPYSQSDATAFAQQAATIGHGFVAGNILVGPIFPTPGSVAIFRYWGLLLSPFWMIAGPSGVYARIGMAALGALAVYNVYAIARYYHSPLAGTIAALPVAVYPSFVLTHSSLLREVPVLAGITTAAHLLITPPSFLEGRRRSRGVLAIGALVFAALLRLDNGPVYLLALVVGVGTWYIQRHEFGIVRKSLAGGIVVTAVASALTIAPRAIEYLAKIHRKRARGRTAYLVHTVPTTIPEAATFAPIGMAYFLFTPFPWMVANKMDAIVAVEALGNVFFALAALWGLWYGFRRFPSSTAGLLVGLLAASLLYGIADANVGTVVRHRQMFIWVVYVFGAVGFTRWIGTQRSSKQR